MEREAARAENARGNRMKECVGQKHPGRRNTEKRGCGGK